MSVVNLNKFRKKKAKEARQKQAETNRRLHGRTNAERARDALQKKKLETAVEHARLGDAGVSDDSARDGADAPRGAREPE